MKHDFKDKDVLVNSDFTVDNGAFTTTAVDCRGYRSATVKCLFGNVPADVSVLTVTNSDFSNMASPDTIANFASGTDIDGAAAAVPTAAAGDGKIFEVEIDLLGKKRYIDVNLTAGNGGGTATEAAILVTLHRGEITRLSAADRGAAQILRV